MKFLRVVRFYLASKHVPMDGVHTSVTGVWVVGAGLGAVATATIN